MEGKLSLLSVEHKALPGRLLYAAKIRSARNHPVAFKPPDFGRSKDLLKSPLLPSGSFTCCQQQESPIITFFCASVSCAFVRMPRSCPALGFSMRRTRVG